MDDDFTHFRGFGPSAFGWLDDLAGDNSRAFFAASRLTFERELRDPFTAMLHMLAAVTGGRPRVFRQLRDMRFAANRERPYWPSIAGEITARPGTASALVADVSAEGLTAVAGHRRPFSPDQLQRYRNAVDDAASGAHLEEVVSTLHGRGLHLHGATLRTIPRGHPRDHVRAALLRHTSLAASAVLAPTVRRRLGRADRRCIGADDAIAHLRTTWAELAPLEHWLNEHVGAPLAADAAS